MSSLYSTDQPFVAKQLLMVIHAPSTNTHTLQQAAIQGANNKDINAVTVQCKTPTATLPEDVLAADGIIIGTTENLGYMAGLTKDFFDKCYYPVLDKKQGLPCALYVRAGHDGTGTKLAIEKIITGLRWRWIQPPLILKGQWQNSFEQQVHDLGMYMAAGLDNQIF